MKLFIHVIIIIVIVYNHKIFLQDMLMNIVI
jgi:hypothetical protein